MEWLANLSLKWVLVSAGLLVLVSRALGAAAPRRPSLLAFREFAEATLVALVVVFLIVRPHVAQAYFIPSESMRPTLLEADRVVVNKLLYRFRAPRRGEILIFRPPADRVPDQQEYIKRVIALPGETVEVVPARLLADGRVLMRLTREFASDLLRESFQPDAAIGFTYPLREGAVTVDDREARFTGGPEGDLRVVIYRPGDLIQEEERRVLLRGQAVLDVAFGTVTRTDQVARWGGDPDLRGLLYEVNGVPRLLLAQARRLSLDPGHVRVDGRRLEEPYVAEPPAYPMPPLRLPPDHLFVLGDNRNHSADSHIWGSLDRGRILGRADLLLWPPRRFRVLTP